MKKRKKLKTSHCAVNSLLYACSHGNRATQESWITKLSHVVQRDFTAASALQFWAMVSGSDNIIIPNKCHLKSVKLNSWAVPLYHVTHNMFHMTSPLCAACDLHTNAPRPLESRCWRQFAAQRGDCKKSRIMPVSAITIIITNMETVGWYW